jgi:formylglycine-generating enzyme required for sulfatase activity
MNGILWEWVHDYFGKEYFASSAKYNPKGPKKGEYRIFRSGNWNDSNVNYILTSFRYLKKPGYKKTTVGFRLAIQN